MKAWDVYKDRGPYRPDELIDTVFYDSDCSADYVGRGLIEHDGYPPTIRIECAETGEEWTKTKPKYR